MAESDLFAARCLGEEIGQCSYDGCHRHANSGEKDNRAVCLAAAEVLADSLTRIAALNGVPRTARSWRHGSIWNRCQLVRKLAADPAMLKKFQHQLWLIRFALILISIICAAVALRVLRYW